MKPSVAPTTRSEARALIVAQANAARRRHARNRPLFIEGYRVILPAFSRRSIQQAVFVVRHQGLVSPETLELAGFNGVRR